MTKHDLRLIPAWVEPRYPGGSIFTVNLRRGDETGGICIQWYDDTSFRVGRFTPGYETSFPGDSPKWNPDQDEWCQDRQTAAAVLVRYLIAAYRDGWCYDG